MSQPIHQILQNRYGRNAPCTDKITDQTPINETIENILTRQSHRSWQDKPVAEDIIQLLLASAHSAPSKSDLQQTTTIIINDKAKQKRLANLNEKIHWIEQAPLLLIHCADHRRFQKTGDHKNHPNANQHLDTFMNAAIDAAIVMSHLIIAAESLGLGCCPVSELRDSIQPLSKELNLPKHVYPIAGLTLGWPQDKAPQIAQRLPLDLTTMQNQYHDPKDLSKRIDEYSQEREANNPTPETAQRHADKYGISKHYGWAENRTRQYATPLRSDFGQYIKDQGFNLD